MKQAQRGKSEPVSMNTNRRETLLVAAVLLAALAGYGWFFATGRTELDGDECYLALQGQDILRGARPVFYYGQDYMGCFEAYLAAFFLAVTRSHTPFTMKLAAAAQALLFLLSAWWLVRRFFSKEAAFIALLLLAFPPAHLAVWLLRVRGYLPMLILGNGILYALFSLIETSSHASRLRRAGLLGLLLGLAWWANPLSAYYIALIPIALLRTRSARDAFLGGIRRSGAAWAVNAAVFLIFMILVSRSLVAARRSELLQFFFEHRTALLAGLAVLAAAAGVAAALRPRENFQPAALCAGFLLGNAPALWVYWTTAFPNLKQAPGGWRMFWDNLILSPIFVFPGTLGLRKVEDSLEPLFVPLLVVCLILILYVLLVYYVARSWRRANAAFQNLALFLLVILLIFFAQNSTGWTQERYLLPIYLPMFVLMALVIQHLERLRRLLGAAALVLLLSVHLHSWWRHPPAAFNMPSGIHPREALLLDYCRAQNWDTVFLDLSDTWAQRLTFFAKQDIVFLYTEGYFNRIGRFEDLFRSKTHFPLICPPESRHLEQLARPPDEEREGFLVYYEVPKEEIKRIFYTYFL